MVSLAKLPLVISALVLLIADGAAVAPAERGGERLVPHNHQRQLAVEVSPSADLHQVQDPEDPAHVPIDANLVAEPAAKGSERSLMRREASAPEVDPPASAAVLEVKEDDAIDKQADGNDTGYEAINETSWKVQVEATLEGLMYANVTESGYQFEPDIIALVRTHLVDLVGGDLKVSHIKVVLSEGKQGSTDVQAYFIEPSEEEANAAEDKLTPITTFFQNLQKDVVMVPHIGHTIPDKKFHIRGRPAIVVQASLEDVGAVNALASETTVAPRRKPETWEIIVTEFVWFLYWGGASMLMLIPVCCYYGFLLFRDEVAAPRQTGQSTTSGATAGANVPLTSDDGQVGQERSTVSLGDGVAAEPTQNF